MKFVSETSESEIRGLRVANEAEELSVSPFSGIRRWRVPASRSVEECGVFSAYTRWTSISNFCIS